VDTTPTEIKQEAPPKIDSPKEKAIPVKPASDEQKKEAQPKKSKPKPQANNESEPTKQGGNIPGLFTVSENKPSDKPTSE